MITTEQPSRRSWATTAFCATLVVFAWGGATRFSTAQQIQSTGPMAVPRQGHTATVLNDGRVLILGGRDTNGVTASAEIFNPTNGAFTPAGTMTAARLEHAATLLPDGRVLITGGENLTGSLASTEIFDPAAAVPFRALTESMGTARFRHTATLLGNGKVLIAGGDASGTAELFDPLDESFFPSLFQMAEPRTGHTATLFSDVNVFPAGGGTKSAEFFDGTAGTFSLWPQQLNELRIGHAAIPTTDAKLLIIGGDTTGSFERFDPLNGSVSNGG
jgi:hypothetical protein